MRFAGLGFVVGLNISNGGGTCIGLYTGIPGGYGLDGTLRFFGIVLAKSVLDLMNAVLCISNCLLCDFTEAPLSRSFWKKYFIVFMAGQKR